MLRQRKRIKQAPTCFGSEVDDKVDDMGSSDDADTSNQLSVNERNNSRIHFRKYPIGALILKELDSGKQSGYVNGFHAASGVYSVEWSDNTEELLTESLIQNLIVFSPNGQWTPYKGKGVYVKEGKTMHEARIESAATDKQGHVIV